MLIQKCKAREDEARQDDHPSYPLEVCQCKKVNQSINKSKHMDGGNKEVSITLWYF